MSFNALCNLPPFWGVARASSPGWERLSCRTMQLHIIIIGSKINEPESSNIACQQHGHRTQHPVSRQRGSKVPDLHITHVR